MKAFMEVKLGDIANLIKSFIYRLLLILIGISLIFLKLIVIFTPVYLLYKWNFQYADKILEYIKVLIWPIFSFYFIHQYKDEIGLIIKKINSVPTPLGPIDINNQFIRPEPISTKSEFEKDTKEQRTIDVLQNEPVQERLKKELEASKKETEAARDLGFSYYLKHKFEQAYRAIFGSQIAVLLSLELAINNVASYDAVYKIYQTSEFQPSYPFSAFIGFILSYGFVTFDGINNTYTLSSIGRRFLNYLREEKLPLSKKPY